MSSDRTSAPYSQSSHSSRQTPSECSQAHVAPSLERGDYSFYVYDYIYLKHYDYILRSKGSRLHLSVHTVHKSFTIKSYCVYSSKGLNVTLHIHRSSKGLPLHFTIHMVLKVYHYILLYI